MTNNQCAVWDLTFGSHMSGEFVLENLLEVEQLKKQGAYSLSLNRIILPDEISSFLNDYCKHWGFQLEKGEESGLVHYQLRVSLMKKVRQSKMIEIIKESVLNGAHISRTATVNSDPKSKNFFNYETKGWTRIAGPWTSNDDVPPKMTSQLKTFFARGIQPWMKQAIEIMKTYDERSVDCLVDIDGNCAKSVFMEYLEYEGIAYQVPPFHLMSEIMEYVLQSRNKEWKVYTFDLPRGLKKSNQGDFYSGIESIKNGYAYDRRHKARRIRFNRPNVWLSTNDVPDFHLLTKGRWRLWAVNPYTLELVPFRFDGFRGLPDYCLIDPVLYVDECIVVWPDIEAISEAKEPLLALEDKVVEDEKHYFDVFWRANSDEQRKYFFYEDLATAVSDVMDRTPNASSADLEKFARDFIRRVRKS